MRFVAFCLFNRINKLRIFSVACSPIPTAPTNHLPDWSGFNKLTRGQKGADKLIDPVLVRLSSAARMTTGFFETFVMARKYYPYPQG
jgi:hypothetical protein